MEINCPLSYAVSPASFKASNLGQANQNRLRVHQEGHNDGVCLYLCLGIDLIYLMLMLIL